MHFISKFLVYMYVYVFLNVHFAINYYREPSDLFIGVMSIKPPEGTTQGDLLAMPLYVLDTIHLIKELSI